MNILGLDFETFGVDAKNTLVIEVGAILVDTKTGASTHFNRMVWEENYPRLSDEVVELTGINDEYLKANGLSPKEVLLELSDLIRRCDVVMCHNKAFDKTVFESNCERYGVDYPKDEAWVCTIHDVPYPSKYTCKKLSHLALDHGLDLSGRSLHRAVDDVKLMLDLVLGHYGFDKVWEYYNEPWVVLKAHILGPWVGQGGDGGVGKEEARKLGYSWEKPRGDDTKVYPKSWVKRCKKCMVEGEIKLAPFKVSIIDG